MASADSPVGLLLGQFWPLRAQRTRNTEAIYRDRIRLFEAALKELLANGASYDPLYDARFQWVAAWLDLCEGTVTQIDPDLEARVAFLLEGHTFIITGRDLAAGEQPDTLALGS